MIERMRWWFVVAFAVACKHGSPSASIDAASRTDAAAGSPSHGPCFVALDVSCSGSAADAHLAAFSQMGGPDCTPPWTDPPALSGTAVCASGCARQAELSIGRGSLGPPPSDLYALIVRPDALCTETPDAQPGDACTPYSLANPRTQPCVPTRAQLGSDGTVIGQAYLACGSAGTCVAAAAPAIAGYLTACAGAGATAGSAGVNLSYGSDGLEACLVAPGSNGTVASGLSIPCVGDWECPEGSLCDDEITLLSSPDPSSPTAVCKPGPRGVLTASMLSQ